MKTDRSITCRDIEDVIALLDALDQLRATLAGVYEQELEQHHQLRNQVPTRCRDSGEYHIQQELNI